MAILALAAAGAAWGADDVLTRVAAHADRFGIVSRQIWESPELGFHENKSSALLQQELRANGFEIQAGVAGMPTAFTATFGSGKPVIALLGEFDALPGLSQKDDAGTVAGEGRRARPRLRPQSAGRGLRAGGGRDQGGDAGAGLKGTMRYYGTPAEEGGGGKIYMLHARAVHATWTRSSPGIPAIPTAVGPALHAGQQWRQVPFLRHRSPRRRGARTRALRARRRR